MENLTQPAPAINKPIAKGQFMATVQMVLLILLIILTGLYAGIHFSGMLNPSIFGIINPAGELMPSVQWAKSWQITDQFMGVRMRVFGPVIMATHILTVLLFVRQWRKPVFWLLLVACALFFADLFFTIQNQVPINQYIQTLNFGNLTADQIAKINSIHPTVIANFQKRELFSIVSFVLVAITPFMRKNLATPA